MKMVENDVVAMAQVGRADGDVALMAPAPQYCALMPSPVLPSQLPNLRCGKLSFCTPRAALIEIETALLHAASLHSGF